MEKLSDQKKQLIKETVRDVLGDLIREEIEKVREEIQEIEESFKGKIRKKEIKS